MRMASSTSAKWHSTSPRASSPAEIVSQEVHQHRRIRTRRQHPSQVLHRLASGSSLAAREVAGTAKAATDVDMR